MGREPGISIFQKISNLLAPVDLISSSRFLSTERTPVIMFTNIGKKTIKATRKNFDAILKPSHITMRGAKAIFGAVCAATIYGESILSNLLVFLTS